MNNKHIGWRKKKLNQFREEIESGQLNAIRELLPNETVQQICHDCEYYFRTRLLTPLATILHMIGAAISREGSFQSAWHNTGQSNQSGSLSKARQRLPLLVWKKLHQWINQSMRQENSEEDTWKGHRTFGVDGTCVSMPDETKLAKYFGRSKGPHRASAFPVARVVTVFDLKTMILLAHQIGHYKTGETELLRKILPRLSRGDLLIADRHYAGANLYAEYEEAGLEYITRAYPSLKIDQLEVLRVLGDKDRVVRIPIHRSHLKKNPKLPKSIQVRMLQTKAKIRGKKKTIWIATSFLDPERYSAQEIVEQLKRRWKVETLIEELKVWLGADVLRSKTVPGVLKELYARVIGLNLIHWLILKAARKHNQDPDRLSVSSALRLTATYSQKMSTAPIGRLRELYEALLEHIALSKVPNRPDRIDPRMRRRLPKHYPTLKISRHEWRMLNVLAAFLILC